MKKSFLIAILGFLLIVAFGLIVLDTKLFELKVILEKRKVLNFSFSSEVLRTKFESILSNKDNLKAEMSLNNLQSSLIDSGRRNVFQTNFLQNLGGALINGVRLATGKPPIRFEIDSSKIGILERSFQLERNQIYKEAYQSYAEALPLFSKGSEESGFILLHQAFCLAAQGEFDLALSDLEILQKQNPNGGFAGDAEILKEIIRRSKLNAQEIEKNFNSPEARIKAYFAKGNYAKVLEEFSKTPIDTAEMKYIRAYSMEKTGNQKNAITEYAALAFSEIDKEIAIKANRRLLMLGHYYNAGSEVARISDRNAERLGDVSEAREIRASAEKLKPISENGDSISKTSEEKTPITDPNLRSVLDQSNAFLKKAEDEIKAQARNFIEIRTGNDLPAYGKRIVIDGDQTKIFSSHFPITLATYTIESISLSKNSTRNANLYFVTGTQKIRFSKAIIEEDQSITLIEKQNRKKIKLTSSVSIELSP
ncbi:hypothetical protein EHQ12_06400 [Leptospira gomenensis]|uniref:Tetratricopeptide repeat protein n=1 Tax=Leptospira gomenensis TaxID=2484974 RepID=A0A5F1YIL3_9LEPT|nr:hypothetical protein [Leptospira gomenensis]TGK38454.1 hypothetical protein EHQ17_02105 [Leptospira gomenensis]TGK41004.1 hypothetical protein EHQ12_06400 [Leptospira gomenensis]TGK42569.1 hypothetical protein EHQ07_14200 [Leptospira gomenensis]TGK55817.1 hypothetical protein EHQ13_16220 [Leptospira gomenensis]